jgi:hypothetical protein
MVNEDALREILVVLTGLVKAQYRLIVSMGPQLQALQETVKGLDPTFSYVMDARSQEEREATNEIGASVVIEVFDVLIQRLKDGEVC